MRLCIVTAEYAGISAYTGGIGVQYARLAPELVRQGHEVHIVTRSDGTSRRFDADGVTVHALAFQRPAGGLSQSRGMVGRSRAIDRLLRRIGPFDVIEGADWQGECWAYSSTRHAGPLVTELHGSMAHRHLSTLSGWTRRSVWARTPVQRTIERAQVARSDLIIAPTEAALAEARTGWGLPPGSGCVVPNLVDVGWVRTHADGRPPRELPVNGPLVAYFGRIERVKGVHVLGEAMRSVWQRWPEASLLLIGHDGRWGDSSMASHVRRLAGPWANRVHVMPNLPPEQLYPALKQADVIALPSLWESFCNAAVEALVLEKPLVMSNIGVFGESFEHGRHGLAVPVGDVAALSAAIAHFLADPDLAARCGESGSRRAESFDVGPVARHHAEVLQSVADRSRAAARRVNRGAVRHA